jgi:CheY-like chemotaxis protein
MPVSTAKTVLLVETNPRHVMDATRVLKEAGLSVTHVKTAQEALTALRNSDPDYVITDLHLPWQDMKENIKEKSGKEEDVGYQPCGINVAELAHKKSIPFAVCITGNHNGPRYQWFGAIASCRKWHFVCGNPPRIDGEDYRKQWEQVIKKLGIPLPKKT